MKRILLVISFPLFVSLACNKIEISDDEFGVYDPKVEVFDDMFEFESFEHIEKVKYELNQLSFKEREQWFEKYNIDTYGRVFTQIMLAEDSISNYYEKLSLEDQQYYRSLPQVHSKEYQNAMDKGLIKLKIEGNNKFFDINLFDKSNADFVNLDGKIKIGQHIYYISECEIYIYDNSQIKDSKNFQQTKPIMIINEEKLSELKSVNENNWSEIKQPIYYDYNWLGSPRKKIWAEISGVSYLNLYFEDETSTCCRSVYSNFVLKGFAQKKNFWGNFVFSGDFNPLIEITGSWDYQYSYWSYDNNPNDNRLCGYYSSHMSYGYNDFPSYYCTPIHSAYCPTSPINMSLYGNGWQPSVSPTGIFSYTIANGLWWAAPFSVYNIDITISIDGYPFNF